MTIIEAIQAIIKLNTQCAADARARNTFITLKDRLKVTENYMFDILRWYKEGKKYLSTYPKLLKNAVVWIC